MKLDMTPILSGATDTLPFSFCLSMEEMEGGGDTDGEGTQAYPLIFDNVTFPAPIQVTGVVTNRGGYMLLTETAAVSYESQCARCLDNVSGQVTLTLEKPVAADKGPISLENKDNDDYVQMADGKLDLVPPMRDEFLLSFPMRFFCREDCAGLCAGCGANLNREPCRCGKKAVDPRLAKLAALLETMPDDEEADTMDVQSPDEDVQQ